MLRVDHDEFAGQGPKVDAMSASAKAQFHSVVDQTLALGPLADSGLPHQVHGALLQHSRSYPLFHVLTRAAFENDGFNSVKVQQVRKHEAGRACPDNPHLGPHSISRESSFYSYRRASTGFNLAALAAGYSPAAKLTARQKRSRRGPATREYRR